MYYCVNKYVSKCLPCWFAPSAHWSSPAPVLPPGLTPTNIVASRCVIVSLLFRVTGTAVVPHAHFVAVGPAVAIGVPGGAGSVAARYGAGYDGALNGGEGSPPAIV